MTTISKRIGRPEAARMNRDLRDRRSNRAYLYDQLAKAEKDVPRQLWKTGKHGPQFVADALGNFVASFKDPEIAKAIVDLRNVVPLIEGILLVEARMCIACEGRGGIPVLTHKAHPQNECPECAELRETIAVIASLRDAIK